MGLPKPKPKLELKPKPERFQPRKTASDYIWLKVGIAPSEILCSRCQHPTECVDWAGEGVVKRWLKCQNRRCKLRGHMPIVSVTRIRQ